MKYAILLESPDQQTCILIGFTNTPIDNIKNALYYNKYTVELKELNNLHISLDELTIKHLKS